jgi:hypothetical protein
MRTVTKQLIRIAPRRRRALAAPRGWRLPAWPLLGTIGVLGVAIAGCGGKSAGAPSAKTPDGVQSCLITAGFQVARESGAAGVTLDVGPAGRAAFKVAFDDSSNAAQADAHTAKDVYSSTGGNAIASGKVLILYALPQPASSLDKVKGCAF